MNYRVNAYRSLTKAQTEAVQTVLDHVSTILSTPKGSVPLYREFGVPIDFIDMPMQVAKARMVAAVREAIEEWEPLATVKSVDLEADESNPGRAIPTVEVEIDIE